MEATVWFENGKLSTKRTTLYRACVSQPLLRFHPSFTPQTWFTDPFVLFQNAIRHEIQDLYIMLRSASLRLDTLPSTDALALQTWLIEFSQLVSLYFLVQERVIYPTLLRKGGRDRFSITVLQQKTKPLVGMLIDVHKESMVFVETCQARDDRRVVNFDSEWICESVQRLLGLLGEFVDEAEKFFAWELEDVASVIEEGMNRDESREMEKRCISELLSYDVGEKVFGGFSQWIPSPVKTGHLSGMDMLKMRRLRRKEKKWFRTHKALQMKFASCRS